jgi:adenylate kinase family enzyme
MNSPHGIIVFGANGSGKTTLGRELAHILGFKHIDIEDYCFDESDTPYSKPRPRDVWISLMLADVYKYRLFVASTVSGDLGEDINKLYKLAVHLSAPYELRMERVRKRAYDQFGKRVLPGGDMHEQEQAFFDFVASRSLSLIDDFAKTLTCPVIQADGTADYRKTAIEIAAVYNGLNK